MSMSEHTPNSEHPVPDPNHTSRGLPEPQKRKGKWRPALIWLIPLVALLIALSLAVKAILNTGPTIDVSFRTAEGLVAGKTTVRYKQVDIGLVRQIDLADDGSHVIAKIELRKDASQFASKDSRFWVVRPRIGTSGVSGIDTLLSGAYIEVDGGKSKEKQEEFTGLEVPPVVASDVPGKVYFLKARDLGSLDIGSPIYYRRINVGQITAYKLSQDGKSVELQTFVRSPYDKFVTTDARFWQASGVDVTLNASGFNLDTQSLASIVAGGIAFGYPESSNAGVAANHSRFNLADSRAEALKEPDGRPKQIIMYFNHSIRGLTAGAPIDFMGLEIGNVKSINVEFNANYTQLRMRVEALIYPSRLANGKELDPDGDIFRSFIQQGWRAQMRTGNLLTGQNYIAFDKFPKAKPANLIIRPNGVVEVPTTPTELSGLQAQVSQIADKLTKFPLVEIGQDVRKTLKNMNTAIESTDKLVKQLDGKVAPDLQATLTEVRKTVKSSESILSSDAPMQQDVRRALQQMTRAAASLQLMADYIEQHPESLIRGKLPEDDDDK
ncbi:MULTISPECIES: PqiB family protein [Acinetobacter]|uniref:MlaD family protein n=3 Tax=Acinetobacter soli TaxID=487316 RepID=A0AB38Z0P5_9GAMM|nr:MULTISPECIES: MlaD family protein [Acinetobacter]MBO3639462.1 MCE family protein [Acinetobacter soli]MCF3126366.1 MlaD family protein [Acinetobacter soli]MDQ8943743.1 MlaD family protein [Acinetobacter soli]WEH90269.1 MlaD family protein [Acinetobacter soli]WEI10888.1 MlaD family protein [Acinetobacter soli]